MNAVAKRSRESSTRQIYSHQSHIISLVSKTVLLLNRLARGSCHWIRELSMFDEILKMVFFGRDEVVGVKRKEGRKEVKEMTATVRMNQEDLVVVWSHALDLHMNQNADEE